MIVAFENYLRARTTLNEEEICRVGSLTVTRKLRRNEFVLREGEICRYKIFIASGMLRTFGMTPNGEEHILQFSPENSWTLDVESYDKQLPAQCNICAVEPCELLLWTKSDFESLRASIPGLQRFAEQLISRNIYSSRQRLLTTLSGTPEEKYDDFVQSFPELLPRLPLKMIASYLGISLKTLDRVRHAQLLR